MKDILGVINTYVEHHGCRVVVIAHDGKLDDKFQKTKEKLFGQTIKVEPQVAEAFNKFCSLLPTPENLEFLNAHQADIIGIFEASGVKSLRVLKHVIEDLARLYETLTKEHLGNVAAMTELVSLFTAFNIEVRSGRLLKDDLSDRRQVRFKYSLQAHSNNNEKPRLLIADERYASDDLEHFRTKLTHSDRPFRPMAASSALAVDELRLAALSLP